MTIVLREMTRDAADAILAGERPGGVRVADDYPTEFSAGVARCVGTRSSACVPDDPLRDLACSRGGRRQTIRPMT
jgi:hypothetical protein